MEVHSLCRRVFVSFWVVLLLATSFCYGDDMNVLEVVGIGECADCAESNFKTSQAFSGLTVSIECKSANGQIKTRASGNLDEQGKFKLSLPQETFENGKLKEDCFAQLHSAKSTPCPAHDGLESTKIVLQSTSAAGKHTFTTAGKLKFSPATCASAFFWPFFKYPPLPISHPWFKHKHKFYFPPLPFTPKIFPPKALPPPVPVKPVSPPSPTYTPKPMPPVVKPPPKPVSPPSPTYTPKPKPKPKPLPPPTPTYTPKPKPKPPMSKPPPVPMYKPKPKPPMSKPPPVPMYKPKPKPKPPMPKPFPPAVPTYPFPKKPCPPLPKLPPIPKFPPKNFPHPKYGFPPLPPHHP